VLQTIIWCYTWPAVQGRPDPVLATHVHIRTCAYIHVSNIMLHRYNQPTNHPIASIYTSSNSTDYLDYMYMYMHVYTLKDILSRTLTMPVILIDIKINNYRTCMHENLVCVDAAYLSKIKFTIKFYYNAFLS
jgi:hypothetical protein